MGRLAAVAAVAALLAGCAPTGGDASADGPPLDTDAATGVAPGRDDVGGDASDSDASDGDASPLPEPSLPEPSPAAPSPPTDAELAAAGVDELGRVPILSWHWITDADDGRYRTSRATLRTQLQDLYDRGYRPVTQAEFASGTFPIPFGTSPVVLTFDDATRGHFALTDDGEVVEDTAVGVLESFAAEHDDWRATAVFGLPFPEPFGDAGHAEKLRWLLDNGYELSNHTWGHTSLASMSDAEVAANLASAEAALREAVPGATFGSLTLPFGSRSRDRGAELSGEADGVAYDHDLVYLFGAYPNRSPHDVAFDPLEVQRVPATDVEGETVQWMVDRLDDLEADGTRFVSDGDPTTVTVPAGRRGDLRAASGDATVRTYATDDPPGRDGDASDTGAGS